MNRVKIKPLSVNQCWQGRRFKTDAYEDYEEEMMLLLPKKIIVPEGKLLLRIHWGASNKNSDNDNIQKPFQDILQKKYLFNDKRIYGNFTTKEDVKKGEEFIEFKIEPFK